ncbi:MAG: hypothetical protein DI564_13565 [Rhodanobacter denitrificans]|uniref:Glycerophosphoryl diester phosphodiesterase membrane domain-containing protein n=1 Tax=Rhodanobacter denitrificans TaxID=666685 RepID=A0A2W5M3K9_9GAMM|nr:MAG: hypothetical protein DI564_13565 [Rhodanobacter denitrificans]
MAGRFARSWDLVKASAAVLRADKELLVFPLLSLLCTLVVAASFIVPAAFAGVFAGLRNGAVPVAFWLLTFAFYVVQYAVIFYFNSALVAAATIRLAGGDPTLSDGFRAANARLPAILGYALIAATVGMVLRAVQERAGLIGRWIVGLIGVAWTVASFLVVPVLVNERIGPVDAVKRSAELLRTTWGENLVGNLGLGLVFGTVVFAVVILGGGLVVLTASQGAGYWVLVPIALTAVALLLLGLLQAALQGVYSAALYRYAATGEGGTGFDQALITDAFRVKA